jgi:hypothetical protein
LRVEGKRAVETIRSPARCNVRRVAGGNDDVRAVSTPLAVVAAGFDSRFVRRGMAN